MLRLWHRAARWAGNSALGDEVDTPDRATVSAIALYGYLFLGVWLPQEIAAGLGFWPSLFVDITWVAFALLGAVLLWLFVPRGFGPPVSRGIGIVTMVVGCVGIAVWDLPISATFMLAVVVGCKMVLRSLPEPWRT
jgi:hypothetical protein